MQTGLKLNMEMTVTDNANVTMFPSSILSHERMAVSGQPEPDEAYDKQKELEDFYATYDVWTGIRTAITLALFFLFTVSIILYKSRCKKTKNYELYPSMEDMPGRPLDYCDYWCTSPISNEMSAKRAGVGRCYEKGGVGMGSAPLPTQGSVGSYSSLSNSFRVKSLPGSVMAMNWSRMSSCEKDDAAYNPGNQGRGEFLRVPGVRLQSTGSSTDGCSSGSSGHELTGDPAAALLGVPGSRPRPLLQLGGMDWDSDHATAEWLQTIDINVIQPTPNISPCSSMRSVSDQASALEQGSLHPYSRSTSRQSQVGHDEDNTLSDSVFFEESSIDESSFRSTTRHSRRSTQPNLLCVASISPRGPSLLGLPAATHLSGSCEKLTIQPLETVSRKDSGGSLQAALSIDEDPQLVSFKVPNLRRTHSASTNGGRNNSVKARNASPVKRADSANNPVKRCLSSSDQRQNSSGSTSSTDEASESVSFHLMVPQLSIDCPSQDVSRASSPSLSPTPPQTPPTRRSLSRGRVAGTEGRGVLRRQFARDFTQPCQQLPTYPEEEEPNVAIMANYTMIRPPPGYRDPSPVPPLSATPVPSSPLLSPGYLSPLPTSPLPCPLSPSALSSQFFSIPMTQPMSPIPPPPSPLYSFFSDPFSPLSSRSSPYTRSHSPLARTHSPFARSHSPLARTYSPLPPEERLLPSPSSVNPQQDKPEANRTAETGEDDFSGQRVSRQRSLAAMTPISLDIPDAPAVIAEVHETSC